MLAILGTVLVLALLRGCVVTSYLIPSSGMENSLHQGERILVNRWSYGLRLPFMGLWGYHRWAESAVGRGDIVVFNNPANLKQPTIDRRELFIGRCIGIPGDTLLMDSLFSLVPRSAQARQGDSTNVLHPLIIPSKGSVVRVYPWNCTLLRNTLVLHEHRQAEVKDDTLYIEGKPAQHCRFTKDYYWFDANSANLSDSRLFGFVPKDHLIGRASLIWFSKKKETGILEGYRWNRFFTAIK